MENTIKIPKIKLDVKEHKVVSIDYIPKWKYFICELFNITPEKRYTHEIEFSSIPMYFDKYDVFQTTSGHRFYVTERLPKEKITKAISIEYFSSGDINFIDPVRLLRNLNPEF